jgi:hypothetical protein
VPRPRRNPHADPDLKGPGGATPDRESPELRSGNINNALPFDMAHALIKHHFEDIDPADICCHK